MVLVIPQKTPTYKMPALLPLWLLWCVKEFVFLSDLFFVWAVTFAFVLVFFLRFCFAFKAIAKHSNTADWQKVRVADIWYHFKTSFPTGATSGNDLVYVWKACLVRNSSARGRSSCREGNPRGQSWLQQTALLCTAVLLELGCSSTDCQGRGGSPNTAGR